MCWHSTIRQPELKLGQTKAWLYLSSPNRSIAELPLLIVSMSSPTIGNTNVMGRFFAFFISNYFLIATNNRDVYLSSESINFF
jgi:hypothetical protein